MKKISYYLIGVIVLGILLVSFWAYQKYFQGDQQKLLEFKVQKGLIQEVIKVRGEVVSQKEFELEFPFSGTVENIFVKEGQEVKENDPLIGLETTDFELELRGLEAQLAQAEANLEAQESKLDELKAGTRSEEIQVQKAKVESYRIALEDAKKNLVDKLQDAYTRADDAIRNKVDQFFSSPQTYNAQIQLVVANTNEELKFEVNFERFALESGLFTEWQGSLEKLTPESDFSVYISLTETNLWKIKLFLDKVSLLINNPNNFRKVDGGSEVVPDTWKSDISAARTNINTAMGNITAAEEKLRTAESNLRIASQELALKQAGTIEEQIAAQEAQVKQAEANVRNYQSQIAIVQEKIRKSVLYAPGSGKITKIWIEKGEIFRPGQTVISFSSSGYKIQADISELEIGKIKEVEGQETLIQLDAFPDLKISGKLISVESKEVVIEEDKYYRVNVYFEEEKTLVRPGMSADLTIIVSSKENVLKIPELAVYRKDNKKFVKVLEKSKQRETEIITGISDGESIEVVEGLIERQTIVVSAD